MVQSVACGSSVPQLWGVSTAWKRMWSFIDRNSVFLFLYKKGSQTNLVPFAISLPQTTITECTHCLEQPLCNCSIKESCVISSWTTTFHHRLVCKRTLHLQRLYLHQESFVCVGLFSAGFNTGSDPRRCTRRPFLHPTSSPWYPTFSGQHLYQSGLFKL